MKLKCKLVIIAAKEKTVLFVGENVILPNVDAVKGKSCISLIEQLLVECTGVSAEWTRIIQLGLHELSPYTGLVALYSVIIPEQTRLRLETSQWVKYTQVPPIEKSLVERALYVQ